MIHIYNKIKSDQVHQDLSPHLYEQFNSREESKIKHLHNICLGGPDMYQDPLPIYTAYWRRCPCQHPTYW